MRPDRDLVSAALRWRDRESEYLYLAGAHSSLNTLQPDTLGMTNKADASVIEVQSVNVAAREHFCFSPTSLLCLCMTE